MITLNVPRPRRCLGSELRIALLRILSPDETCAKCGAHVGVRRLEIDHVDGREWSGRLVSRLQRAKRYWAEFLADVRLRALCRTCNAIDGNRRRWAEERKSA